MWLQRACLVGVVALLPLVGCPSSTPPQTTSAALPAPTAVGSAKATTPARGVPAGEPDPPRLALGANGAVSSAEANATRVGIDVLKRGGNAVDAAIAIAFALAVTHPSAGNIGGGGFMIVHLADGRQVAIDYREKAPGAAHRDMYLDQAGAATSDSLVGPKAAGIPGTVAGMALAHAEFGQLKWSELVAPAVSLAREGHRLDAHHVDDLASGARKMRAAGLSSSAAFFDNDGAPYREGELWKQPELAATLALIAADPRAFYQGSLADKMATEVQQAGGIWRRSDLAEYQAVARKPIRFSYRGHDIVSMPPPSGGGVVLRQILGSAEALELFREPWQSVDSVHPYVESARRAYADRNQLLGDVDFVTVPVERLLDVSYVAQRAATIDRKRATPSTEIQAGVSAKKESEETTHFSVMDRQGNAVANTYTLNTGFGSKFVIPGTGVLLNNEMDDFSVKPGSANVYGLVQSEPNAVAPGKRMLSSMTPTIVLRDGTVRAVVGSPGGPTITTTVAQIIRALIDYEQPIDVAVAAPRIHHQWLPDQVFVERATPTQLQEALQARGHQIVPRGPIGHANCIEVDSRSHGFRAVADVQRDGGLALTY